MKLTKTKLKKKNIDSLYRLTDDGSIICYKLVFENDAVYEDGERCSGNIKEFLEDMEEYNLQINFMHCIKEHPDYIDYSQYS